MLGINYELEWSMARRWRRAAYIFDDFQYSRPIPTASAAPPKSWATRFGKLILARFSGNHPLFQQYARNYRTTQIVVGAAHNCLIAGRAFFRIDNCINSIRLRRLTHRCEVHQHFGCRLVPHADSQLLVNLAIRPICTPQLLSSHIRTLDFFRTGDGYDLIASDLSWFGAEA